MAGTIVLGIDVETGGAGSAVYAEYGAELFHKLQMPVTWYIVGRVLAENPKAYAALKDDPFIDLQCHTYSHVLLKTVRIILPPEATIHRQSEGRGVYVDGVFTYPGGSLEKIEEELSACDKTFVDILRFRPIGLTGPWGYYRGLMDRPDILAIVDRHGYKFVRTFARCENDFNPVPMEWQPFWYKEQGFPGILELMVNDFQDDFYWAGVRPRGKDERYIEHLKKIADHVAAENIIWSLCSHDHCEGNRESFDKKTAWIKEIILYARSKGIEFMNGKQYYEKRRTEV